VFGAAAAGLVAVSVGLGAFLAGDSGAVSRASFGDGLSIELVAPVEPKPEAGEVMDVGEVTDGFVYVRAQMEPERFEPAQDYWVDEPVYVDDYQPPLRDARVRESAVVYRLVSAPEPMMMMDRDDLAFGFDAPRRDYRAEREDRRARIEALAQRSSEPTVGWEPSPETTAEDLRQSDSTFY
jgi:hypothetical protein